MSNIGLQAIRKFNRFELKYILPLDVSKKFQEDLRKYVNPDQYSKNDNGLYALSSLYYDTEDYRFFWEKIDGLKFRRKLRIRHYETNDNLTDESIVFVEIKQRIDRTTQKRRAPMKYKDALLLCDKGIIPEHEAKDSEVIHEIRDMVKKMNLQPSCITSYFRNAYFGTDYDSGLRITFDSNIRYRKDNLDLANKQIGEYIIDPNSVIMEVKANEKIPYRLTQLIAQYNIRLIRISKYCQGLQESEVVPQLLYSFA